MRNRFVLACSVLFVSSALGVGGEEAKFEKKIQGSWEVEKAPNRLLTRLVVTKDDKGFWVEVWATRGLKDEMVQKAPLHLLRAGIGEKGPVGRGLAMWKEGAGEGEATLYATLGFNAGDFVLELSKLYREPKRNANWFTSFALKKSTAASGPKGKIIDPVGNPMKGATIREKQNDPPKTFTNSIGMKFVWIPPGSFMMGSPKEEKERKLDETQHKVTLTKGFYMGVYAVTPEEWQTVVGKNPSFFKGEKNLPVERISWDHCQDFVKKMRDKDKKPYLESDLKCLVSKRPFDQDFGPVRPLDQNGYFAARTQDCIQVFVYC
jgi:formylglycine-generating enzyme required for sulfatase activity